MEGRSHAPTATLDAAAWPRPVRLATIPMNRPASLGATHKTVWAALLFVLLAWVSACGNGRSSAPATALQLGPAEPTVFVDGTLPLQALLQFADGTLVDIGDLVVWTSADTRIATVDSAGRMTGHQPGAVRIQAEYEGFSSHFIARVEAATPLALTIDPATPSLARGTSIALQATLLYNDGRKADATHSAIWSSRDPGIATVGSAAGDGSGAGTGAPGRLLAVNAGQTEISVTHAGLSQRVTVTVTPATLRNLSIEPASIELPLGSVTLLHALAQFSDDTVQDVSADTDWRSPDAAATVGNTPADKGRLQGTATGTATLTARYQGLQAQSTVRVTPATVRAVQITPAAPTLASGTSLALTATAVYSDASTRDVTALASWTSAPPGTVRVDANGLLSGLAEGRATVSARYQGQDGSVGVEVTAATPAALFVVPGSATIAKGTQQPFSALAVFSDGSVQDVSAATGWISGNPAVATIDNAFHPGLASALAEGQASITAIHSGLQASAVLSVSAAEPLRIEISPARLSLPLGQSQALQATLVFSDGHTQDITDTDGIVWTSGNPDIIEVYNTPGQRGLARAVSEGATTLSASFGDLRATLDAVASPAALTTIEVTPADSTLPVGYEQGFRATGVYSDGRVRDLSDDVSWESSDPLLAAASNAAGSRGRVSALATGSVRLSATLGTIHGATDLRLTSATLRQIQLTPAGPVSLPRGRQQAFSARGLFSDDRSLDLTTQVIWSSTDPGVASVDPAGLLSAVAVGGPIALHAARDGIVGAVAVSVTDQPIASLTLSPLDATLPRGLDLAYTATAVYADGSSGDVTRSEAVNWSSSNPRVVSIGNASETRGVASALSEGSATITVGNGSVSAATAITVTGAALARIELTPAAAAIAKGTQYQFRATGYYTDSSTRDVTELATWGSSHPEIASVSNATGLNGRATGLALGEAAITARIGDTQGSASLAITAAVLERLEIVPATPGAAAGSELQLQALGSFSDGSVQDLTESVTWRSTDTAIVALSNEPGTRGLARALKTGTAQVLASVPDRPIDAEVPFTVTASP